MESRQWGRRAVGAVGALGWRVPARGSWPPLGAAPAPTARGGGGGGGAGGADRVSLFPLQVQVKLVSPWGSRPQSHHEGKASLSQFEWLSNSGSVGAVAGLRVLQRQVCVEWLGVALSLTGSAGANIHRLCVSKLWSQLEDTSPKLLRSPKQNSAFCMEPKEQLHTLKRLKS